MRTIQTTHSTIYQLASLLEELSAGCDPDFDASHEDLNREFAEVRLLIDNE